MPHRSPVLILHPFRPPPPTHQAFAQAKGIRITFLVGDSHLAYVGAFHTNGTS